MVFENELLFLAIRVLVALIAVLIVWMAVRKLPKYVRKEKWGKVFSRCFIAGVAVLITALFITHETKWRPKADSTSLNRPLPELTEREVKDPEYGVGALSDPETLTERNEESAEDNKQFWKED